mmetsp:Transcript_38567/g.107452  ORF Transcript_38567/g.107452 Transcript_38567/m.107452 type:complete len:300 (-) Transcript_38567:391-1290(-)
MGAPCPRQCLELCAPHRRRGSWLRGTSTASQVTYRRIVPGFRGCWPSATARLPSTAWCPKHASSTRLWRSSSGWAATTSSPCRRSTRCSTRPSDRASQASSSTGTRTATVEALLSIPPQRSSSIPVVVSRQSEANAQPCSSAQGWGASWSRGTTWRCLLSGSRTVSGLSSAPCTCTLRRRSRAVARSISGTWSRCRTRSADRELPRGPKCSCPASWWVTSTSLPQSSLHGPMATPSGGSSRSAQPKAATPPTAQTLPHQAILLSALAECGRGLLWGNRTSARTSAMWSVSRSPQIVGSA